MPMFDDPQKELEKLQEQLLQDEDWFAKELDSAKAMIGDQPLPKKKKTAAAGAVKAASAPEKKPRPADTAAHKSARKSNAEPEKAAAPKKKSNRGLIILALLETAGIAALAAYWVLFLL